MAGRAIRRHAAGDWGDLDAFGARQNNAAVREGRRILSAYSVPVAQRARERIWIITEWDRSAATVLKPEEY